MEIPYELNEKDFKDAFATHKSRKVVSKWFIRVCATLTLAATVFLAGGLLLRPSMKDAKELAPFFIVVIVWFGLAWFIPRWSILRQFKKQPAAQGPRSLLLDDNGFHWRWGGGSSDINWKNYIRAVEGRYQFLFYTSPACFNIVPKRALPPDQINELRELLKQHMPFFE